MWKSIVQYLVDGTSFVGGLVVLGQLVPGLKPYIAAIF